MKKLIGLIFVIWAGGLVASRAAAAGGAECSARETVCDMVTVCDVSSTFSLTSGEDDIFSLQHLLDAVAVIVFPADMLTGKTSAKNDCFKNCKGCEGRPRGNLCRGAGGVAAYSSGGVAFARAIDRYVYAFRHIII